MRRTCCKRATIGLGSYPSVRARAPGQFDFAACRGGRLATDDLTLSPLQASGAA